MSQTAVLRCKGNCQNEFQDAQYGKGKRAMNKGLKGFLCTVCGREGAGADPVAKVKKKS